MKAIVYTEYGPPDVLLIKEVKKPAPKENEVLIKVHATSVNAMDYRFLTGTPYLARLMAGLLKPKHNILGLDVRDGLKRSEQTSSSTNRATRCSP